MFEPVRVPIKVAEALGLTGLADIAAARPVILIAAAGPVVVLDSPQRTEEKARSIRDALTLLRAAHVLLSEQMDALMPPHPCGSLGADDQAEVGLGQPEPASPDFQHRGYSAVDNVGGPGSDRSSESKTSDAETPPSALPELFRRAERPELNESIEPASVVQPLCDVLGRALVAVIAGATTDQVSSWASGVMAPDQAQHRTLLGTVKIVDDLLDVDDAIVVRAWFIGMNPQLDDDSPAEAIAKGRICEVAAAADEFIQGA